MAEKIDAIKEELTATPTEALEAFVEKYASDSRTGVQKLVDTAKKRMDKLQKEMIRTENLKKYEKDLSEDSQTRLEKNPLRVLDSKDEKDKEEALNLSISILRSLAGVLLSIATAAMPCSL